MKDKEADFSWISSLFALWLFLRYSITCDFHDDFSVFHIIKVFFTGYQNKSALSPLTAIYRKIFAVFDFVSTQATLLQFFPLKPLFYAMQI